MKVIGSGRREPSQARRILVLSACLWALRLLTAAGLAVDAYVHADLAATYDPVTRTISQGDLFRIEAGAAALAAVLLVLFGTRPLVWAYALLVAAAGLAAVLLYHYVDVGTVGPLPNMYEPAWYPEKTASAVAEAAATLTAAAGLLLARRLHLTAHRHRVLPPRRLAVQPRLRGHGTGLRDRVVKGQRRRVPGADPAQNGPVRGTRPGRGANGP